MHNDAYSGASHGPDVAFIVPVFVAGPADRLCRHDGAPSRHRRAVAGLVRHRRGDRRLCRGPAVQGHQGLRPRREERDGVADRARQHPRLRPRGRRHGRPGGRRAHRRRAHGRAGRALWAGNLRPGLRRPDGSCRAADAPGDRQAARRRLSRRDGDRRLSRQRRSLQEGAADRRHHHQEGRQPGRRPHRHGAAGARPADQHAARRHRRHRDLAHHPLGAARHRDPRPHPGQCRPDPADHHRGAQGVPRQPDLPRARPSPASARATSSPTR